MDGSLVLRKLECAWVGGESDCVGGVHLEWGYGWPGVSLFWVWCVQPVYQEVLQKRTESE